VGKDQLMDVLLIPGLWLDGASWEAVLPGLERAGHRPHPLTLPGMQARDADRSSITLHDHVAAVVAAIDAIPTGKVVVVGHSGGCGIAWAAVDARPDRVARAVLVGGFPSPGGGTIADAFAATNGEVPLPDFAEFDDADLVGLDEAGRARFRERALPSPEHVVTDLLALSDDRRYDVPVTLVCPEYTSAMLRDWLAKGAAPLSELPKIKQVDYLDLPTGHWPQFTRPDDLATAIVSAIHFPADRKIDDQGRPEPPPNGDELATLVGYLEFQRATFAWKCSGLDEAGLRATTAASTLTLGGMMKHLALVEQSWFRRSLHDRPYTAPWDAVDWTADRDWDFHSADNDTPEELRALWYASLVTSRACLAEALAAGGLAHRSTRTWPDGTAVSVRWILAHMIEEYARHNGHADLIRESIDGQTGE
jgi:pimeloyl-ACP methyl ester carboxylesterase